MFLCNECHEDDGFCEVIAPRSRGPCERCHQTRACIDCPRRHVKAVAPEANTVDTGFVEWWKGYAQVARAERWAVGLSTDEKSWDAVRVVANQAWEDGQLSVLCYECAHPQIRHAPDTHYFYMLVCYEDADCSCQREITQDGEAPAPDLRDRPTAP